MERAWLSLNNKRKPSALFGAAYDAASQLLQIEDSQVVGVQGLLKDC